MKVGHQDVHGAEAVAGGYEQVRLTGIRPDRSVLRGCGLDQPQRGGANGHDAPSIFVHNVKTIGNLTANASKFRVHLVLFSVLCVYRKKGARPDMEGHLMDRNALGSQSFEQRVGEMQAGCGGGDRPLMPGEQRLIVAAIALVRRPPRGNVGGQRHISALGDGLVEDRAGKGK